ncbi:hypothetical protein [Sphingomonas mali]|uniref:hypothetical protein n=1 Tax=Sphingomonas mali TaxID=40682 RepID=UPI0012ED2C83|nr:hypothetical protein [Sphingomonas mali]
MRQPDLPPAFVHSGGILEAFAAPSVEAPTIIERADPTPFLSASSVFANRALTGWQISALMPAAATARASRRPSVHGSSECDIIDLRATWGRTAGTGQSAGGEVRSSVSMRSINCGVMAGSRRVY